MSDSNIPAVILVIILTKFYILGNVITPHIYGVP